MWSWHNPFRSNGWLTKPPEIVAQHINEWPHRPDIGDPDSIIIPVPEIARLQHELLATVDHDAITVFRCVNMSMSAVRSMEADTPIGQRWTLDRSAKPLNPRGDVSGWRPYLFTALVRMAAVDWLATITLRYLRREEIRLRANAEVILLRIERNGEPMRLDLEGEPFTTAALL